MSRGTRATLVVVLLVALFWTCVGVARAGPATEALALADTWWAARGHVSTCVTSLDRQLNSDNLAGVSTSTVWTWTSDGSFAELSDCNISINPIMFDELGAPNRMDRRRAWIDLGTLLLHERGHQLCLTNTDQVCGDEDSDHALGGIMTDNLEAIHPPHEVIEWAIAKTPRR